jgi:hypothetical protein
MGTGQPTYPVNLSDTDKVVSTSAGVADAGKLIKTNASGLVNSTFLPEITPIRSYIAGENITADDAVTAGFYQADGGITFDASASKNGTIPSGGGTATQSFTVGNHTNRVLVAVLDTVAGSLGEATNVTFNGVAMTSVIHENYSYGQAFLDVYVLFNPDVTTANFSFTLPGAGGTQAYGLTLHSYYNVTQSVHLSNSVDADLATISLDTTPTLDGVMILSAFAKTNTSGFSSIVNAANNSINITTNVSLTTADSGFVFPKKLTTVSATFNGVGALASVAFSPITAPTFGVVLKTDGSALANAANLDKANNFIGFATETKNAGETIKVQIDGVYSSLSGLNPFQTYYVSDTNGAIANAAGTISKKVGKAISATDLLIQHDNA